MADSFLTVMPADPHHVPTSGSVDDAARCLREQAGNAEHIAVTLTPTPRFVDAGANWEGVACPSCGADLEEWWSDAMEEAARSDFQTLDCVLPCCGIRASLNDLAYGWPVGFARLTITARNPRIGVLSESARELIASALGCTVRVVPGRV